VEAAAGETQVDSCDEIAEVRVVDSMTVEINSAEALAPEALCLYSRALLLAHRDISLRIARGPPGLEMSPVTAAAVAVRDRARLRTLQLPEQHL